MRMRQQHTLESELQQLQRDGIELVDVGNDPQVLLDDDFLVESTENIEFVPATLKKHEGGPVLLPEYSWEKRRLMFPFAMYDDEEDVFKLWYRAEDKARSSYLCYAVSRDGFNWEKPRLGLYEFEGSTENNIIMPGIDSGAVIKDYGDPNPETLYKMGFSTNDFRGVGLFIATSPDGIRWKPGKYAVLQGGEFDSHNVIVWDDQRGEYLAGVRHWRHGLRQIRTARSNDLYHWPKLQWTHGPDEHDPDDFHLYTPGISKYSAAPNLWVMLTTVYDHVDDRMWPQMALSRDASRWTRYRHEFVPLGPEGAWDSTTIYASPTVCVKDDTMYVYYRGEAAGHGKVINGGPIGVGTLRRDGFVALTAGRRVGVVTTRPLTFSHDGQKQENKGRLTLNINAAKGQAKVELLDLNGTPIPGFTKHECDPIKSDSTLQLVSWQGRRALDQWLGKPIKVRIYLTDAQLYSLRFLAYVTRGRELSDPEEKRLFDLDVAQKF